MNGPISSVISDGYIELKFGPRWKYISAVRAFIQNFIAISIKDQTRADKIAIAASELLENAVKYADGEYTHINLNVSLEETEYVKIEVENKASKEAIEKLQSIFSKIKDSNPLQAYITQMKEAATRNDGQSQLGLARIRYEVGDDIHLSIKDQQRVSITLEVH